MPPGNCLEDAGDACAPCMCEALPAAPDGTDVETVEDKETFAETAAECEPLAWPPCMP